MNSGAFAEGARWAGGGGAIRAPFFITSPSDFSYRDFYKSDATVNDAEAGNECGVGERDTTASA